tara:strand:+ start:2016 stop:2288 length:273 start_codon:yes stop_codon:yes gene_type:complete
MAVTTVNLSDTISQWVTKTNTISTNLGDISTLATPVTTNTVAAINSIKTRDSAGVRTITNFTSFNFDNVVTLQIFDSSGSVLKTLRTPGS